MEMLKTKTELLNHLQSIGLNSSNFDIAVEALIFKDDTIVLVLRGPGARDEAYKLEGIGGKVGNQDENLLDRLQEEIKEEIGCMGHLQVRIEHLLEVRQVSFIEKVTNELKPWLILSHLCRYEDGEIFNCEPANHEDIKYLTLKQLYEWPEEPEFDKDGRLLKPGLSKSLIIGRETYKDKYKDHLYYQDSDKVELPK